jgi:hypothetical protein
MNVLEIRRFPIKSLVGERVDAADIEQRGIVDDRRWAVRDPDGKLGSGKSTRRFRRMPGLLDLRGRHADPVPVVELPDGRTFAADDPAGHDAVSRFLGRSVTIVPEAAVPHHDEGPVSLITTAGLRQLDALTDEVVDPVWFRANLLIDAPGRGFVEDGWLDGDLRVGPDVVLRPRERITRCTMVDMAQDGVPAPGGLLRAVTEHHDMTFGVWATVVRTGRLTVGDAVTGPSVGQSRPAGAGKRLDPS